MIDLQRISQTAQMRADHISAGQATQMLKDATLADLVQLERLGMLDSVNRMLDDDWWDPEADSSRTLIREARKVRNLLQAWHLGRPCPADFHWCHGTRADVDGEESGF